jgi:predicted MFS family arabinose efflux permease
MIRQVPVSRLESALRPAQTLAPAAAIVSAGFMPLNSLPFMVVGISTGLHLDAIHAGLIGTIELSGAILGSLAVMPLVSNVSRTKIAIYAMVAGSLFELISCACNTLQSLAIMQLLAGAGCGAALAAGNALSASAADPAHFYMKVLALQSAFATVLWSLMPTLLRLGNHYGVFAGTAAVLLVLAGITALTSRPDIPAERRAFPAGERRVPLIRPVLALVSLAGVFFCCMRDGVAWTLADKIGTDLGISDTGLTLLFATIGVVGLIGLLASARLTLSHYPVARVVVSVVLASACTTGLLFSSSATVYLAMALPWAAVQFLALSYLTSLAAEIDSSGRVSAAAGAAFQCAYAVAPITASATFAHFGYGAVGQLSLVLATLTIAAGWWTATRVEQQRPGAVTAIVN